jgi:hypothetical protein
VQRYKVVPVAAQNAQNYGLNYDLRVSNDGKMAVRDTANLTPNGSNQYQELYLTSDIFLLSQQALTAIGSGITLTQTAATISGKPAGNLIKRTLYLVTIQYADTPNNTSYEYCDANMANVMGVFRTANLAARALHGVFRSPVEGATEFATPTRDKGAPYKAVRKVITGEDTASLAKTAWRDLDDDLRKRRAKTYGINQYAKPETGEGLGIFNPVGSVRGHYAAIIARSGGDYITIENYRTNPGSLPNPGAFLVNPNWYLRMFGTGTNQSWYDFHRLHETGDYSSTPIAIRYRGI